MRATPTTLPAGRSAPPVELTPPPSRWHATNAWPRWIPMVVGGWLFVSIFLWPHTGDSLVNTGIVALLLLGCGAVGLYVPWLRWVNAGLGIWLCLSTLTIEHLHPLTRWHDLVLGLVVLGVSFAGPARPTTATGPAETMPT